MGGASYAGRRRHLSDSRLHILTPNLSRLLMDGRPTCLQAWVGREVDYPCSSLYSIACAGSTGLSGFEWGSSVRYECLKGFRVVLFCLYRTCFPLPWP